MADCLLGQSTASEIGQGVRSLGRPDSLGGVLHQLQGIGQGQPRGLSGGFLGGLDGLLAAGGLGRVGFARGGHGCQLARPASERPRGTSSPESHHQRGGVPMFGATVACHQSLARVDGERRVPVVVERAAPPERRPVPHGGRGRAKQVGRHGGQVDPIADRRPVDPVHGTVISQGLAKPAFIPIATPSKSVESRFENRNPRVPDFLTLTLGWV